MGKKQTQYCRCGREEKARVKKQTGSMRQVRRDTRKNRGIKCKGGAPDGPNPTQAL
jgi:hypothetical protein